MVDRLASLTFSQAIIIGLVVAAIYYSALYNDGKTLEANLAKGNSEVQKLQGEIQTINEAIKDSDRFEQLMVSLGEEMLVIQKAIPSKLTTVDFMKIVSTEAKGVGAEINTISGDTSAASAAKQKSDTPVYYEPVSVNVDLTGNYNQVMLFLSNLTRLDKIVTAKTMRLTNSDKGPRINNNPSIKITAVLRAYKYAEDESGNKNPNENSVK